MSERHRPWGKSEGVTEMLVRSGRSRSRDKVLLEGVRLVEERETCRALIDASSARGLADAEANRIKPIDAVVERLVAKYTSLAKAQAD